LTISLSHIIRLFWIKNEALQINQENRIYSSANTSHNEIESSYDNDDDDDEANGPLAEEKDTRRGSLCRSHQRWQAAVDDVNDSMR